MSNLNIVLICACVFLIFILLEYIINLSALKKKIRKSEYDEEKVKEIVNEYKEMDKKALSKSYYSDKSIYRYLYSGIVMLSLMLIIFPYCARMGAISDKSYDISLMDESSYSVIYVGKDEAVLKPCAINGDELIIDDDSFVIKDISELRFKSQTFNKVYIKDID